MSTKVRVLAIVFESLDHDAGLTGRTADILNSLKERGAQITLYALGGVKPEFYTFCDAVVVEPRTTLGFLKLFARVLWRTLVGRDDVVVVNAFKLPLTSVIAKTASVRGRAVLCDMQDLIPEIIMHVDEVPAWARKAYFKLSLSCERHMVRAARLVLSPGREANNILRRRTGAPAERFAVWHNAHSYKDRRPAQSVAFRDNEAFTVVYLGGIQPVIRGLEVQIETLGTLVRDGHNVNFLTFTAENQWLLNLLRKSGLEGHFQIRDYLPREQALDIAAHAHAAVMRFPLGTPSKFFDHVSIGNLIVAQRDCLEISELLTDDAIFDGSSADLTRALRALMRNYESVRAAQQDLFERVAAVVSDAKADASRKMDALLATGECPDSVRS